MKYKYTETKFEYYVSVIQTNQKILSKLLLYFLFFLLVSPTLNAKEIPSWANESVQLGLENIVFSGIGSSYEDAQRNALTALMSQLSSQVKSEQQIIQSNHNGQVQQSFVQNTNIQTLELDIGGLDVLQQYENSGEYAVQISVARQTLERTLIDRITTQTQLSVPFSLEHKDQVLWALQNKGKITQAQRYERALAGMKYDTQNFRKILQKQSQLAAEATQNAGIRIIYPHNMQYLATALGKQFPSSTSDLFLLKVEQQSSNARRSTNHMHRIKFIISLLDAQQPFTPYFNQEVTVVGLGKTTNLANKDAQNKLLDHINQDLSVWFFN